MIKTDKKAVFNKFGKWILAITLVLILIMLVSFTIFTATKAAPNDINTANILEMNNGAMYVSRDYQFNLFFVTDSKEVLLSTPDYVQYLKIDWQSGNIFACSDTLNNEYIFMQTDSDTITCDRFADYLIRHSYENQAI